MCTVKNGRASFFSRKSTFYKFNKKKNLGNFLEKGFEFLSTILLPVLQFVLEEQLQELVVSPGKDEKKK
jgi:hypothetical protein